MEVNRDEAEKCLKIGAEALRRGDYSRAVKFVTKSLQLYPLPGAEALLSQAQAHERMSSSSETRTSSPSGANRSNGSAPSDSPPSSSSSFRRQESTTGADGREYTEEQARIVQHLLRAKEGGRGAHYRVLGLESNCTDSDIKKAYRRLSLKVHPDKNSAPHADEAFKAVGLAYATLSDPQKRSIYDRYGQEDPDNVAAARRGGGVHMNGQEVSPEDIFNMFFGGAPGMGGMGPGFHMYTNGFGGPGIHFQAGGMPRRRAPDRPGAQQQQQQQQQPQVLSQMIFQFLPVILIFLVSFLRLGDDYGETYVQNRYFSLTPEAPFVNPLTTKLSHVKEIPYFVSDKFMRTFYRDRYQLAQVERLVEKAYEIYLVNECDLQQQHKKSLQRKASQEKDPSEQQKVLQEADGFPLTRCVELDDLFPGNRLAHKKNKQGERARQGAF